MAEPLSIADPALRQAVEDSLRRKGELLVLIRHIYGLREWWLVTDRAELERALARLSLQNGSSDAVELYATGELPFRGTDPKPLKARALDIVRETDVVMACKRQGDPELRDVDETNEATDIEAWFAEPHDGVLLVGAHPLLVHDQFFPQVDDAYLAYSPLANGSVKPGSY